MNNQKRIDILKKRNIALSSQLDDAKKKIQEYEKIGTNEEQLKSLMNEITNLEKQFKDAIEDLNKARNEYIALNRKLVEIKQDFQICRIPWYRKIFSKKKNSKK